MADDSVYRDAELRFPVSAEVAVGLGEQYALARTVDVLKTETDAVAKLPGYRFAVAKVENQYIAQVQSNTLALAKLAAKHGVDLETHQLATVKAELVAVPLDLVAQAEQSA